MNDRSRSQQVNVLIVGPGPRTEGGITEVIARIIEILRVDPEIHAEWIATHQSGNAAAKFWRMLTGLARFVFRLSSCDVVHVHSSANASFMRKSVFFWLARIRRIPVIWHLHAPNTDFSDFFGRRDYMGRYARKVLSGCAKIVVLSDSWVDLLAGLVPPNLVQVIYNPVPERKPESSGRPVRENQRILYLAHLIPRKGYSYLIRAYADLCDKYPDSRLVFAGSGEVKAATELCRELGIVDRVDFLGWIKDPARTNELEKASIFVLPSFQEGLPMGVLEAMKYRLALVTTPVGGIGDVVENGVTGLLVEPGDEKALAKALETLLADPALCRELGDQAVKRVGRFEPTQIAPQWKQVYLDVLTTTGEIAGVSNG